MLVPLLRNNFYCTEATPHPSVSLHSFLVYGFWVKVRVRFRVRFRVRVRVRFRVRV